MKVEFTQEEIQMLYQLLDLAVKQGGLQVAEYVLYFAQKLKSTDVKNEMKE